MILSILISTIDEGINKIQHLLLPQRNDVNYLVVHHYTDKIFNTIPVELLRDDIIVQQFSGKGVSKARNISILQAKGEIALIADDDVTYTNEYFDRIINTFIKDDPDLALFKIKTMSGEGEYKDYRVKTYQLSLNNLHSISSIEIAFKIQPIKNKIKFDERFGSGSFLIGGEEDLFILDAIKNGLIIKYYPYYVVNHPEESHVKKFPTYHKKRVLVRGAFYARTSGWLAIPKILLKSIALTPTLIKEHKNPIIHLYQMYIGCFYILFNNTSE